MRLQSVAWLAEQDKLWEKRRCREESIKKGGDSGLGSDARKMVGGQKVSHYKLMHCGQTLFKPQYDSLVEISKFPKFLNRSGRILQKYTYNLHKIFQNL